MVAVLLAGAGGCGQSGVKRGRAGTPRQRLEFKGEKGKLVIEGAGRRLPKGFPPDMPIYKPSRVKSTISSRGPGEAPMTMAIFTTKTKVPDVAAFYQNNLAAGGWTVNNTVTLGESAVTYAVTKVDQAGSISISEDKETNGTIISINMVVK